MSTSTTLHLETTEPSHGNRNQPGKRRTITRRSVLGGLLGTGAVAMGGGAWALERFVIDDVQISDVTAYEQANSSTATSLDTTPTSVTSDGFTSPSATTKITKVVNGSGSDTVTYYVADITLTDATALRSAFAQNEFGQNIIANTSVIAQENNAILALNGDYYGFRETGMVIRNGVAYRDKGAREGLAFYRDGSIETYDETATNAKDLVAAGVWQTLSFGPTVLRDGAVPDGITSVEVDTNIGNHSIQGNQPRTAIGVVGDNHLLFMVVDGRSSGYSRGVTLPELGELLLAHGAHTGYNIDGGGSSTLWFNGSLLNNPLGKGQERGTSDILYLSA